MSYDVIVIGGGHNGLTAAAYLARAGRRVAVLEARGTLGGQLLSLRPNHACGQYATPIDGLYLGGSGSHPGGGLTCGPGRLAAAAILDH